MARYRALRYGGPIPGYGMVEPGDVFDYAGPAGTWMEKVPTSARSPEPAPLVDPHKPRAQRLREGQQGEIAAGHRSARQATAQTEPGDN